MSKLLILVKDLSGRTSQNSFRGLEDIATLREEKEFDEVKYKVLKPSQDFKDVSIVDDLAKGWEVIEREIFA